MDRDYEQTTEVEDVYDHYDNRFIVTFRYLFIYCKPHTYLQGPHNSSQKLVPILSATPKDLLTQGHYLLIMICTGVLCLLRMRRAAHLSPGSERFYLQRLSEGAKLDRTTRPTGGG